VRCGKPRPAGPLSLPAAGRWSSLGHDAPTRRGKSRPVVTEAAGRGAYLPAIRPRGVRPQRPGNRVSSRPPILSDAASPVAVLFQTIPNFIQPGPGAVVIQFSSRGTTCANRSNRLIPELDHNSTAKEHDVRQLR
jgi:hypothetical protein